MQKLAPWVSCAAAAACGGSVVFVEDGGEGGSGGSGSGNPTRSTTTGKATSSSGVTTGSLCDALLADFESAVAAAAACDPLIDVEPCTVIVEDTCGCPTIALSGSNAGLVQAVRNAYQAWVDAGCGPYPCETCDPARGATCQPTGDTGVCVGLSTF